MLLPLVVCSISSMRLVQWCAPRLTRQSSGSVKFVDIPNCHCSCERCGHHGCPSNPHVLFVDRSEFIAAASRATNSPLFFRPITPTPPALTFSTVRGPSQLSADLLKCAARKATSRLQSKDENTITPQECAGSDDRR
uniref:Secreted protein n=1 Tax=Plectus sambesii TaxID=2011161 RepID=A0A914XBD7_9BILA